jgi:hypothetical protein
VSGADGRRPWLLVGPWYRWPRQNVPARRTRPVLQKYDSSGFVTEFLKDPQRSLKFGEEDFAYRVDWLDPLPPLGGIFQNRRRRLSERTLVNTGLRKVFLDIHKRFYLVVCELHCDAPGFPSTGRDQACEAGLVVRRRRLELPVVAAADTARNGARQATRMLRDISSAAAHLAEIDRLAGGIGVADPQAPAGALPVSLEARRSELSARLTQERDRLATWAEAIGAQWVLEGWVPSAFDRIGSWQPVADRPQQIAEVIYPLYPLVPDPRLPDHAGAGRTIYFGPLPTGGAEAEPDGSARFDDHAQYHVRCFVRRHDPRCPRRAEHPDCHGEVVWSEPTEEYRLASHFDLDGSANRPITIQLPDVPALEARAATARPGQLATVKMVSPAGSSFQFPQTGEIPTSGSSQMGGGEVCTFSIPLITIVATFVFKLFLPIVVLVFNLWFLLKLKFCIPPSAQVSANLASELSLIPASVPASADIDADPAMPEADRGDLQAALAAHFDAEQGAGAGAALTSGDPKKPGYTNRPLIQLHRDLAADYRQAGNAPSFTASLEYEEHVDRSEVTLR